MRSAKDVPVAGSKAGAQTPSHDARLLASPPVP